MKKKIILVVIVVFAVAVSGVFVLTKCLKTNSNHEQVNVVEEKDEEFNLQEEEQSKDEITTETDEIENKTSNGKRTILSARNFSGCNGGRPCPLSHGKSESPKEDTSKQENKSKTSKKVSETPKKAETKSSNVPTTSSKSQEEKQENKITESNKNNGSSNQGQQNKESTTFYDSITHGKKEFSSESEALRRGTEIQNKELDYVLDWNEEHPDNQIQPEINYFRVYPSAIDENGKYWYYLHFFCISGEGLVQELKSKY